jgi:glycosyltransferase involved in cell wall biosynthesis
MATGAVAVASDVGGCRELITSGETGFLLPPGDPDAVAGAVMNVLGSPQAAARLAAAARARIEAEFTVEAMVRKTTAVYTGALDAKGSPVAGKIAAA